MYLYATLQNRLLHHAAAPTKDTRMNTDMQWPRTLVGLDAHSAKLALCVAEWHYGQDPRRTRPMPDVALERMEQVYLRHVPKGALTVVEASTNSSSIAQRLAAIGYAAVVVRSDILGGISERDRVNDRIDAEKLTVAYARRGAAHPPVFVPSGRFAGYRELFSGYKAAAADATRASNRLWFFCSHHGLALPPRSGAAAKRKFIEAAAQDARLGENELFRLNSSLADNDYHAARKAAYEARIHAVVAGDAQMRALMQLHGVSERVAFALVAFVEDVRRFDSPRKLVSYLGLNPSVCGSGKSDTPGRQAGRPLSRFGRDDLKALLCESAQSVLRHRSMGLAKWGRGLLARGKPYNKVVGAVARKLATYAWHVLMGHPTPDREGEATFRRKIAALYSKVGAEAMKARGFTKRADFVEAVAAPVYAHLGKPLPAAATA